MEVIIYGMGKKIKLTKGMYAIVDAEDYEHLNKWKWYLSAKGYAVRKPGEKCIFMHRLLNKTPDGMQTDHINRNKLDNRKSNLRTVDNQRNHFNMPIQKSNTSGHRGVSWVEERKRWVSQIMLNGRNIYLGRYHSLEDAIKARKDAEEKYHAI